MTDPRLLAAFAVASVLIVLAPGPSVLFVVGRALAHGRRVALASAAGNAIGAYALVAAVSLGLGPLVERSVVLFTVLKLAGAAYLVHLGVKAWRERGALRAEVSAGAPEGRLPRLLWEGFAVGAANPKTLVFFAAVLPQFVDRAQGHVALQMLLLGLVFSAIAVVCDSGWALGASTARAWFARSPRRLSAIGGAGGLCMIGLGATVAATGRKD
ncbi:LysE family translocator [Nocardiopsis suaedae]|uniref:LysE family translocator n=1 Tax=Nocardiopsis suaedae TaxID=3018444 RepID=A0ABT4THH0_9ACTN|nr:LysE family translocator [Nocardiopsis suaedae]MDA2804105.1 LysE family translocator [Nocardiopsis suaedae]